jgi:hypothetical protein
MKGRVRIRHGVDKKHKLGRGQAPLTVGKAERDAARARTLLERRTIITLDAQGNPLPWLPAREMNAKDVTPKRPDQ